MHKSSCRERVLTTKEKQGWEAPSLAKRQESVHITTAEVWHPIPDKCCVWEEGQCGIPECVEVPTGDQRRLAIIGDSTKPRVQGRVSIVVPTMHDRFKFHSQLFLCYRAQTYVDKELIVIDSGRAPSPFFEEHLSPDVKYIHIHEQLSAGEKRNLAIREHSTGEMIANFDDDDLYFPAYLQTMVKSLKTSKAAMIHMSAWNVLDAETGICATFNASKKKPSEEEALSLVQLSGFSMVYTYAAWCNVPWPHVSSNEDKSLLHGFAQVGLPIATRAEIGRAMTILHVQHGGNMGRSVCHTIRTDGSAIKTMIDRFEQACRRILQIPEPEYDQMGHTILHPAVHSVAIVAVAPAKPTGLHLLAEDENGVKLYEAWQQSGAGLHPNRAKMLQDQREHPTNSTT